MTQIEQASVESSGVSVVETKPPPHPIGEAIDRYLHTGRDIRYSAGVFIPAAASAIDAQQKALLKALDEVGVLLNDSDPRRSAHGIKMALTVIRRSRRMKYSNVPAIVESSLFLSLFSAFDLFTGEFLRALYSKKPALFDKLDRSISLSEVLGASSLEQLKNSVLDEEIETFRRKSYSEQFEYLELAFGLPLRKFERWANFIEAAQRRNLLTHCGGVVSDQYRSVCLKEGYPAGQIAPTGTKLRLGPDYFLSTSELMLEVGAKLGQTLWRKILPNDLEAADQHLLEIVFDSLVNEQWERASTFGEFFVGQKILSSDKMRRLAVINYAIALKNMSKGEKVAALLSQHDWSASINDFRLAEAILLDKSEDAVLLMKKIGKEGEILREHSYHSWPLFGKFRERVEFQQTYEAVYGYPFVLKLQTDAHDERENLKNQPSELLEDRGEAAADDDPR